MITEILPSTIGWIIEAIIFLGLVLTIYIIILPKLDKWNKIRRDML